MLTIDLNSDLAEGYPYDESLMPYLSSVNIACGAHAGSAEMMKRVVELAIKHNLAIGAHPSYPDKKNFGRVDLMDYGLKLEELPRIIIDQLTVLDKICTQFGTQLHHVKLHGALYNRAARDPMLSACVCKILSDWSHSLILYGLSGSKMEKEAESHNIPFLPEAFADRSYCDDGSLTPRTQTNSLVEDLEEAVDRVLQMLLHGTVKSISGKEILLKVGTICIHGDGKQPMPLAMAIRRAMSENNIALGSPAF